MITSFTFPQVLLICYFSIFQYFLQILPGGGVGLWLKNSRCSNCPVIDHVGLLLASQGTGQFQFSAHQRESLKHGFAKRRATLVQQLAASDEKFAADYASLGARRQVRRKWGGSRCCDNLPIEIIPTLIFFQVLSEINHSCKIRHFLPSSFRDQSFLQDLARSDIFFQVPSEINHARSDIFFQVPSEINHSCKILQDQTFSSKFLPRSIILARSCKIRHFLPSSFRDQSCKIRHFLPSSFRDQSFLQDQTFSSKFLPRSIILARSCKIRHFLPSSFRDQSCKIRHFLPSSFRDQSFLQDQTFSSKFLPRSIILARSCKIRHFLPSYFKDQAFSSKLLLRSGIFFQVTSKIQAFLGRSDIFFRVTFKIRHFLPSYFQDSDISWKIRHFLPSYF